MHRSGLVRAVAFIGVSSLAGGVAADGDPAPDASVSAAPNTGIIKRADPFPRHDELVEQTAFWRNVYGYWSQQQVALHDLEYPGIVYEVVELPGPRSDSYTAEQRKFVDAHRKDLEQRLQLLEQRYKAKAALSDSERELLYRISVGADESAVIGAADRVRSQRGLRERFSRGIEISGRYEDSFREIFKQAGLPEDLSYLPHVESSFQANARSSAGAVGIWQFTRSAGRLFLKVNPAIDERLDPVASARGAARYLRRSYDALNDWAFAVTSYNHGVEGMLRAKRAVGDDFAQVVRNYQSRSFGFASKNFYTEFLAARDVAGSHGDYFPEGLRIEPPLQTETVVLDRKTSAVQLAQIHGVSLKELSAANPAWSRRAARGDIPLPAGVEIWLPPNSGSKGDAPPVALAKASAPATTAAPQVESGNQRVATSRNYHVVRRKETLYSIARLYGTDIATLRELNGMGPKQHVVKVGQKLKVIDTSAQQNETSAEPAQSPIVAAAESGAEIIHVVSKGETAFDIAARYGVSLKSLLHSNELTKHSVIYPGQKFRIPQQ
jgi:membrane-bound lytic murein transglycosylase D